MVEQGEKVFREVQESNDFRVGAEAGLLGLPPSLERWTEARKLKGSSRVLEEPEKPLTEART
jgi:hypothetical protein